MLAQMLETKPNDKTYEAVLSVLWRCPTSFESTSYFVHIEDQMWAPTCRMQTINVTVCRMQTINVTVYILNVAIHFRNQMLIKKEREREKKWEREPVVGFTVPFTRLWHYKWHEHHQAKKKKKKDQMQMEQYNSEVCPLCLAVGRKQMSVIHNRVGELWLWTLRLRDSVTICSSTLSLCIGLLAWVLNDATHAQGRHDRRWYKAVSDYECQACVVQLFYQHISGISARQHKHVKNTDTAVIVQCITCALSVSLSLSPPQSLSPELPQAHMLSPALLLQQYCFSLWQLVSITGFL